MIEIATLMRCLVIKCNCVRHTFLLALYGYVCMTNNAISDELGDDDTMVEIDNG